MGVSGNNGNPISFGYDEISRQKARQQLMGPESVVGGQGISLEGSRGEL